MITTTKDIFYLVLSICILWITTFTCWLLYYAIATARDLRRLKNYVEEKIVTIEESFANIRSFAENAFASAGLVSQGVKMAMQFAKNRKDKKKKKRDEE